MLATKKSTATKREIRINISASFLDV